LVLGGGGVTGIAWELGLLAGLAEAGVDLASAAVIVGTSAGSVVGAQIASATSIEALYLRQLEPPSNELPARLGSREKLGYLAALLRSRGDLARLGRHLGAMSRRRAGAGALPSVEQRLAMISSRLPSTDWPDRDLRVTVVDAQSGEFRVITRRDGVPLVYAVAASCAVPGGAGARQRSHEGVAGEDPGA
jgi:NTE family protein